MHLCHAQVVVVLVVFVLSLCFAQQCVRDSSCSSQEDVGYFPVDQNLDNYLYIGAFIDIHESGM